MRYTIKGYTGPYPDFSDTIELPDTFNFSSLQAVSDPRYHAAFNVLLDVLIHSTAESDYLDVYSGGDIEMRPDLADHTKQVVLIALAYGCDYCRERNFYNYSDGCEDAPHGDYMLRLEPVEESK